MDLTTKQAHKLTGYSESWLRELASRGWVKAYKKGREWRFDEPVLKSYQPGKWISIAEASTRTDYTPRKLESLAERGEIEAVKVGDFWLLNWPRLLDYLHQSAPETD